MKSLVLVAIITVAVSGTTVGEEQCGPDEQYYQCLPGCRRTCETYNKNILCRLICRSGCYCREGLVKRKDGKCVAPAECSTAPETCGINEKYDDCGTACEPSCKTRNPFCIQVCVAGCFCNEGYIRSENGECILEDQCPPVDGCPLINCLVPPNGTCYLDRTQNPCGECVCSEDEVDGCPLINCLVPPNGSCYLDRTQNPCGECVCRRDEDKCGENEEFNPCGSACPPTCRDPEPEICTQQCIPGCFCKSGLVRADNGTCIHRNRCHIPYGSAKREQSSGRN